GLSPQLKLNFEQIFSAPFLVELLLAEIGSEPAHDLLLRLHFDGAFQFQTGGVMVVTSQPESESAAQNWLTQTLAGKTNRSEVADLLLQAWWCLQENKSFNESLPPETERRSCWRAATQSRVVELGWLARQIKRPARYETLTL